MQKGHISVLFLTHWTHRSQLHIIVSPQSLHAKQHMELRTHESTQALRSNAGICRLSTWTVSETKQALSLTDNKCGSNAGCEKFGLSCDRTTRTSHSDSLTQAVSVPEAEASGNGESQYAGHMMEAPSFRSVLWSLYRNTPCSLHGWGWVSL